MRRAGWMGLVVAALAWGGTVRAQVRDTTQADSTRADTTDYSELFIKSAQEGKLRVPTFPRLGRPGLLPALTRRVFDRDSIEWHNAETISDLLTKIPGVFVWRGGWMGRPEPINYQGRATASTEFLLDGVPYLPLGQDSLAVDPSLFPLTFFDRVEVERLPGLLRVYLYTRQHDRLPPRTRVGVASGDFQNARYIASLEKRTNGGFGFTLAAEHLAVPLRSGDQGPYSNTQEWLQASFVPPKKPFRAMVQLFHAGPNRGDIKAVNDAGTIVDTTLSIGVHGKRTEFQANLVYQPGKEDLGWRIALQAARSGWSEDSTLASVPGPPPQHVSYLDQSVWQLGGQVSHRTRISSLDVGAWHRSRWTPLEVRANGAAASLGPLTASIEGVYQQHDFSRTSKWGTGRLGLNLPLGVRVSGMARVGTIVRYPMIRTAEAVSQNDLGVLASFDHPRIAAEVGYWRTDAFTPMHYPLYPAIDSIGPSGTTEWLTVSARLAPMQWFILDGWYSNPIGTGPEGVPPTHSIVNATIQSRYLPTFKSGIFALKLQASMETWGKGIIGRDVEGNPIAERGATFFRAQIEMKIGDFVAYYDRANFQATQLTYLPGLPILRLASTFGVRWEFSN